MIRYVSFSDDLSPTTSGLGSCPFLCVLGESITLSASDLDPTKTTTARNLGLSWRNPSRTVSCFFFLRTSKNQSADRERNYSEIAMGDQSPDNLDILWRKQRGRGNYVRQQRGRVAGATGVLGRTARPEQVELLEMIHWAQLSLRLRSINNLALLILTGELCLVMSPFGRAERGARWISPGRTPFILALPT